VIKVCAADRIIEKDFVDAADVIGIYDDTVNPAVRASIAEAEMNVNESVAGKVWIQIHAGSSALVADGCSSEIQNRSRHHRSSTGHNTKTTLLLGEEQTTIGSEGQRPGPFPDVKPLHQS
jgi:hypothetical protein